MNTNPGLVSVVIPTGGNQRFHLLKATLASLQKAHGIDQIILAETGAHAYASELARAWDIDYVFSRDHGSFSRSRTLNMGSKLARQELILWCDGDTLFDPDLLPRAVREIRRRRLDVLMPFSAFHCLNELQTQKVISGQAPPSNYTPDTYRNIFNTQVCGGLVLVRSRFLKRFGGLPESFRGWGYEDNAWVHKVKTLGKIGWDEDSNSHVCNLFHSNVMRDEANVEANRTEYEKIVKITDRQELLQAFAHERPEAPPWRFSTKIAFFVTRKSGKSDKSSAGKLAKNWIQRLAEHYSVKPSLHCIDPDRICDANIDNNIEMSVVFAETAKAATAMLNQLHGKPAIVILMSKAIARDSDLPSLVDNQPHWLLPRTTRQAALWHGTDNRIWHRSWESGETKAQAVPVLVQLLSLALETKKRWSVKIELDRSALPAPALDRSPFWYVALQDAEGNELSRCDAELDELTRLTTSQPNAFTLERTIPAAQRPTRWVVQPTDRHRNWLERMEGNVNHVTVNNVEVCF